MRFPVMLAALAALALQPTSAFAEQPAAPAEPIWAFEASDIPVDPAYRFGVLDNRMRYILRQNTTPEGTAMVRLHIGSGSLDENEYERGLAHFLEHMAFNGSKQVPEGEMIKLLEREGLAFGADTNASTGLEQTVYRLDLPRNDESLCIPDHAPQGRLGRRRIAPGRVPCGAGRGGARGLHRSGRAGVRALLRLRHADRRR